MRSLRLLQFPTKSLGPPPLVSLLWHLLCFALCSSIAGSQRRSPPRQLLPGATSCCRRLHASFPSPSAALAPLPGSLARVPRRPAARPSATSLSQQLPVHAPSPLLFWFKSSTSFLSCHSTCSLALQSPKVQNTTAASFLHFGDSLLSVGRRRPPPIAYYNSLGSFPSSH
jgi:hypothetical protein